MDSLFVFADILKSLKRVQSQVANLAATYETVEARTAIDEALIDQFNASASAIIAEADALKGITFNPQP